MADEPNSNELLAVRPAVTAGDAALRLRLRSPWPPFFKIKMEKTELVWLPHYLFTLRLAHKGNEEKVEAAVDAVAGHFAHWKADKERMESAAGQEFEIGFMLTPEEARARLIEEYRWVMIATALKTRKRFEIKDVLPGPRAYYPFFAGYYRSRHQWRFEVLDAVSGLRQGGKVREALLMGWMGCGD
ncbi:MAG TPA: hypothetical protein VM658_10450 [bacterium]|nr:hypothetical protein [bacterium]